MNRVFFTVSLAIFIIYSLFTEASSAAVNASRNEGTSSTTPRSRKEESMQDAFVYPTELQETLNNNETLNRGGISLSGNLSPCPNDELYCEFSNDYPKEVIKTKLKKQPKLLFDTFYEEELDTGLHEKFGPESETEIQLCTSSAKIVYPNKAKSKEGVFEFVVNDDEHRQGIRVETCTSNGPECNMMSAENLPLGYTSQCVQKFILRTLVVLNRNSTAVTEGFVTKPFEFPSCCSCVIKMSVPDNKFGGVIDTTPAAVATQTTTRPVNKGKPKYTN